MYGFMPALPQARVFSDLGRPPALPQAVPPDMQFVVGVHGEILNPVVVKSVDPYLDKEAIRVISSMPKWKPGKQRGKAVRVKYTVPVVFRLQS